MEGTELGDEVAVRKMESGRIGKETRRRATIDSEARNERYKWTEHERKM
jgi:hypothetical protein